MKTYYWRVDRPTPEEIRAHALRHPIPRMGGAGWWQRRTYDGAPLNFRGDSHGLWGERERVEGTFAGEEWRPVDADGDAVPWPSGPKSDDAPDAVMGRFLAIVAEIELPGEAVAVWVKFRAELAPLSLGARNAAWRALCGRTEEVGRMRNAKVWLKTAIAAEDARHMGDGNGRGAA